MAQNGGVDPTISNLGVKNASTGVGSGNTGAPAANIKPKGFITPKRVGIAIVVVIIAILIWKFLVPMFKKPDDEPAAAAVTAPATGPSAVTGVKTEPTEQTTEGTTKKEPYTDATFPNKRGLKVIFKTPLESGDPGSESIASYNIYLRAADPPDVSVREYLVDKDVPGENKPAFTRFTTGSDKTGYYERKSGATGAMAGGIPAELFIDGSIIAGLTNGTRYKIGIQATNKNGLSSPDITFSEPMEPYNACAFGESTACGWDSTGVNTAAGNPNADVLLPAVISLTQDASGAFTGTTAEGTPCQVTTPAANSLYKFNAAGQCVVAGCTKAGDSIVNGVCTRINMPGDACVPAGLPADSVGFVLYNVKNPDGTLNKDAAGSNVYVCDASTGAKDLRTKSCPELKPGITLPGLSKWGAQPGCLISCISSSQVQNVIGDPLRGCREKTCELDYNPQPPANGTGWSGGANMGSCTAVCNTGFKPTVFAPGNPSKCVAKTCALDMTPTIAPGSGSWDGTWGACVPTCLGGNKWGTACLEDIPMFSSAITDGRFLPNPATATLAYFGGVGNSPPTYFSGTYIFGKNLVTPGTNAGSIIGLYKMLSAMGSITSVSRVWDIGSGRFEVENTGLANVVLGTKTFVPTLVPSPAQALTGLNTGNIASSALKSFRIDNTTGNLIIKYTIGNNFRTMAISPAMMAPSAAAIQYVPTA